MPLIALVVFWSMRLIDRVAQARIPLMVQNDSSGARTRLSGVSDCAEDAARSSIRYVLSDELTRVCAALAYSKGARTLSFIDLIHIPAERIWVEWCEAPWRDELTGYGFPLAADRAASGGRRGACISASPDGRHGHLRTFWCTGDSEFDVHASSMQAHFDLNAHDEPRMEECSLESRHAFRVVDNEVADAATLRRCFRFEYERSWAGYYDRAELSLEARARIARNSLSTIALDIPVLLAFFLMLGSRAGLPQRPSQLERLNRSRSSDGKSPLLDHVEMLAPMFPEVRSGSDPGSLSARRGPRLHQVRGHLVRRRNQLFWRVPHLRGHARLGRLRSRTVTWTFDRAHSEH
jgi:hypothetical protein